MRMSTLFGALVGVSTAGLLAALASGLLAWGSLDPGRGAAHRALALGGAILVLLTHSIVFVYMIGTGRTIKDAVRDLDLDPHYYEVHKSYKWRTAPWALLCALAVTATAVLGGLAARTSAGAWLHPLMGLATLLLHAFGLPAIWRAIGDNGRLLDRVASAAAARRSAAGAPGGAPAVSGSALTPAGWSLVLAASAWLPWLYVRFVMGRALPAWPFAAASALALAAFALMLALQADSGPKR